MLMKQLKMLFQATPILSSDRGVLNSYDFSKDDRLVSSGDTLPFSPNLSQLNTGSAKS